MRVSVLRGAHDLVVEERPDPEPGPRDVVVRIASVGVCGSDVHYYEQGRIGSFTVESPLILGHEASGEIVSVGELVDPARIGQRVALEPGVPDFTCDQCSAGRYNLCLNVRFFATPPVDGAFAELVALNEQFAHPIPSSLSDDGGALLEPLSVGLWACRKAQVTAGSRVLVTGAGPVGLMAAQAALALGAADVTVTDVNPHRLALAKELGATATLDVSSSAVSRSGVEAEVLLECSGQPAATTDALQNVIRAGRVVLVGMGGDVLPLPVSRIQEYELTVTGTFRYAHTWPAAIALVASGRVELDRLVTGHYKLDEVEKALTVARKDPLAVKPVVRPGS
jgi:L-iditol 2-dehydrogenase